jgi:hypothetical protein
MNTIALAHSLFLGGMPLAQPAPGYGDELSRDTGRRSRRPTAARPPAVAHRPSRPQTSRRSHR